MAYYTNLFSPETFIAFENSDRTISGFRKIQQKRAQQIKAGDKFICYMTKFSRWVGVLEVLSECFVDDTPIFHPEDDPFVVRFKVQPLVWLPRDKCIPVQNSQVWDSLSFTKELPPKNSGWTGIVRRSLNSFPNEDGTFLEELLKKQKDEAGELHPIDSDRFRKFIGARVRRADKVVTVTVPESDFEELEMAEQPAQLRTSYHIQAVLAQCGERMGFKIWLPRSDRSSVQQEWQPTNDTLFDRLPLDYDDTTLRTIEQIDVLWLKGRSIVRAFEVEHTTAVYSGILRMAGLLALQPNMDIKLHIVAPETRKQKVFIEILRPVFSLLERAPLSESCTFLSYDSVEELLQLKHIDHISDSVLDEYSEEAE